MTSHRYRLSEAQDAVLRRRALIESGQIRLAPTVPDCSHAEIGLSELVQFLLAHRATQSAQELAEMLMREYGVCRRS